MNTREATAWSMAFDGARSEWTRVYQNSAAVAIRAAHTGIRLSLLSTRAATLGEARALGAAVALADLLSTREA